MNRKQKTLWTRLGNRLLALDADRYNAVVRQLKEFVGGHDLIAKYDHQIILRAGRPSKRYLA